MKIRKALGFLTVTAAAAVLMCASAYAATTYAVSTVSGSAGSSVTVPVTATSTTADDQINGYVLTFTYDASKVTPVATTANQGNGEGKDLTGSDCYATMGESFSNGIIVADTIENEDGTTTLAVAWASATPVALTANEATELAKVEFEVAEEATGDVELTVQAATVAKNSTDTPDDTVVVASGSIDLASVLYGDVDGDTEVTPTDASLVARHAAQLTVLDDEYLTAADVDGDGEVTPTDASLIARYAAQLITAFPVEG